MSDREQNSGPFREENTWPFQFLRFWSAFVDALERYLDRMDEDQPALKNTKTGRRQ